jgi:hypothetical protein
MAFNKVDKENRLVYGFATLDNVDKQGDRILPEANLNAFGKSRRNLREMHSNIAAGKVVDFGEQEFIDPASGEKYRGVFVKAYISKGAQPTWEKVLDETLTGFSIGGNILEAEPYFDKANDQSIRIIKDYELVELSLVDNPANQFANIFAVEKDQGVTFVKGMAVDTEVQNVFWCPTDELATSSTGDAAKCGACSEDMQNIGWFEDTADSDSEIGKVVNKFLSSEKSEGGVTKMTDTDTITKTDEVEGGDKEETTEVVTAPDVNEDGSEKETEDGEVPAGPITSDDVNTDTPNFEKMFNELSASVTKAIEESSAAAADMVKSVETSIEDFKKSTETRLEELDKKYDEISKSLEAAKSESAEVSKKLETLSGSTAIKKSDDVEEVVDENETQENQSVFKGTFLPLDGLNG